MGATLLLVGLVAAVITAPLFDRFFARRLAISIKCICPVIAAGWVALIFGGASASASPLAGCARALMAAHWQ